MSNHSPALAASHLADDVRRALSHGHLIDITTIGRRTGEPRRIELTFHALDRRVWISGMPSRRPRAWLRNLEANPRFTFHLKGPVRADLPARARVVTDPDERRRVLERIAWIWKRTDVDAMVDFSPLIEVEFEERSAAA
jgi:deazaflavin-dependent oxidoreductase (nitroreductase family)